MILQIMSESLGFIRKDLDTGCVREQIANRPIEIEWTCEFSVLVLTKKRSWSQVAQANLS